MSNYHEERTQRVGKFSLRFNVDAEIAAILELFARSRKMSKNAILTQALKGHFAGSQLETISASMLEISAECRAIRESNDLVNREAQAIFDLLKAYLKTGNGPKS